MVLPDILVKYHIVPLSISLAHAKEQILFAQKAREFYFERIRTGKDGYESFKPESLLSTGGAFDTLPAEIELSFRYNGFKDTRRLYGEYLRSRGPGALDKRLVYYLASFLPEKAINFARKLRRAFKKVF